MKRFWYIYAEVAARPCGKICCGKYNNKRAAENDIDRVAKIYPAYCNFRVVSKQVPDNEPLYSF